MTHEGRATDTPEFPGRVASSVSGDGPAAPANAAHAAQPSRPAPRSGDSAESRAQEERFRIAVGLTRVEARLERLLFESAETGDDIHAIARHLTAAPEQKAAETNLAELLARMEAAHKRLEELAGAVSRMSRLQFKANALQEGGTEQVREALAALQELSTRHGRTGEGRDAAEPLAEGRVEMAVTLLPVLDGLERALDSGGAIQGLRHSAASGGEKPTGDSRGLLRRLLRAVAGGPPTPDPEEPAWPEGSDALEAWLEGVQLGRDRFLALLAEEGIRPIPALGAPFDPHLHAAVASEVRDDVAPRTVVRVLRNGYRRGDRPIRFAEVVVSRTGGAAGQEGTGQGPASSSRGDEASA